MAFLPFKKFLLLHIILADTSSAFSPPQGINFQVKSSSHLSIPSSSCLHLFGRNNKDEKDPVDTGKNDLFSFFRKREARKTLPADGDALSTVTNLNVVDVVPSQSVEKLSTSDLKDKPHNQGKEVNEDNVSKSRGISKAVNDPIQNAESFRLQAERIRLEAEKLDAELTLEKIVRLEQKLAAAERKGESTEALSRDLENMQRKSRGEPAVPSPTSVAKITSVVKTTSASTKVAPDTRAMVSSSLDPLAPFSQEEYDRIFNEFDRYPRYLKILLARSVGMQPMSVRDINVTEYALRSEKQQRLDFSFLSDIPPPQFTQDEIIDFKNTFSLVDWRKKFPPELQMNDLSDDAFLMKAMEEEYYFRMATKKYGVSKGTAEGVLAGKPMDTETFANILEEEIGRSQPYQTMQSLFPKCVEKEGKIPTEAQVKLLISDVLPQAGFIASSSPIEVFGGYLIRGSTKKDNGDSFMDTLDEMIAKNPVLQNRFTISYIKDLTGIMGVSDADFEQAMMTNLPRALYVMGPDVTKERNRVLSTFTSGLGVATSWYLSIYPFLLNPALMKQAEEQLALADASMAYDMGWLTDLSVPMFVTFISLQLIHELGHRVVSAVYGFDITLPTFVPSLASGITSSITNFKSLPKNREQLFDFAIAGPLAGIVASLLALYMGLQLTAVSDQSALATFPALPIEILRQSSLGGGVIEYVLGNGILSIPDGAVGSKAVASINIPLHPVAIAGYISLIVNALSLLPIGITDGGRISQAVFNRAGKQIVGQIFLLALFAVGLLGDDLFLFYGFFCAFFQQGSEIPQRNEVDDISFSRVLFATAVGVVALLSIIPMQ